MKTTDKLIDFIDKHIIAISDERFKEVYKNNTVYSRKIKKLTIQLDNQDIRIHEYYKRIVELENELHEYKKYPTRKKYYNELKELKAIIKSMETENINLTKRFDEFVAVKVLEKTSQKSAVIQELLAERSRRDEKIVQLLTSKFTKNTDSDEVKRRIAIEIYDILRKI